MSTVTTFLNLVKPAPLEPFSRATYVNNLDLIDAGAVAADKQAKGLVYIAKVTATTGVLIDTIANHIPSFTFKAGRKYRIVWDLSYYATGNSDSLFFCGVHRAAVTDVASALTGLTIIGGKTKAVNTAYALQAVQHTGPVIVYYEPTTDVTTMIKFRVERVFGDDGMHIVATVNEPCVYSIYDDGAQF